MNRPALLALAVSATLLHAGCQTVSSETSDGRPMPPAARRPQSPPADAPVNAISVLYAPKPTDANANGRPDQLIIEMYLFVRPFPTPVWREGIFVISAFTSGTAGSPSAPGAKPFHVWKVDSRALGPGRFRSLIGEGYRVQISLIDDGGTDVIRGRSLDFATSFQSASGGDVVWCDGIRSIAFDAIIPGEVR